MTLIILNVSVEFFRPVFRIRFRCGSNLAILMMMPKTAIYKYDCLILRQHHVRLPRISLVILSESEAFSEKTPKDPEPAPAGNKENQDFSKGTRVTIKEGDTVVKEFSLSLSDMDYALRNLVNKAYASKEGWYSTSIYPDDSNVIFYDVDSDTRKYYRQSYEKDGEEFKLVGERVEVKPAWLSADEQAAVDAMKANYSALETEVKTYRKKEALEINKSVVTDKKFASIADTKEVSELMNSEEFASMSKDEVTAKLNAIVVDYVASGKIADFSARKSSMVGLPIKTSQKNSRYGGIFRNHNN